MGSGSSIRGPSTWRPSTRPAEQLACRLLTRGRFVGADGSVTPAEGLYIVAATVVCGEGIERRCPTARRSRRRLRLPVTIVTPAFDGAVGAQPARMRDPSRHRHEHCVGGVCLSVVVRAPAFASAVGAQPTGMIDRPTPLPGSSLVRSPSSSGGFATCGACCLSPTAAG